MALTKATVLIVAVFACMVMGIDARSHPSGRRIKLRKKEVSLYFHDTVNVTDFRVVDPPRPVVLNPTDAVDSPFGAVYLVNDVVTEGPDLASEQLGNLTGAFIAISLGGFGSDYMTPLVLTLSNHSSPSNPDLRGLHGTLTMSGIARGTHRQPQPITGGTNAFAFALGTYNLVPVQLSTNVSVLRIDLVLYWPPYA